MAEAAIQANGLHRATDPILARFLLQGAINQLREQDERGYHALAQSAGVSYPTWKRWMNGKVTLGQPQLQSLLYVFGYAPDHEVSAQLFKLAADARRHNVVARPEWLSSTAFDLLVAIERVSEVIQTYEMTLVPGLLQTEEYARAYFRQAGSSGAELDQRVRLRLDRQAILTRSEPEPVRYTAVIDEAVLHRSPAGPDIMRGQLTRLLELSALENVEVRVIPYAAGPYSTNGNGPFVLLTSAQVGRQITYVETSLAATYYETPQANRPYAAALARLAGLSLGHEASTEMIHSRLSTI